MALSHKASMSTQFELSCFVISLSSHEVVEPAAFQGLDHDDVLYYRAIDCANTLEADL